MNIPEREMNKRPPGYIENALTFRPPVQTSLRTFFFHHLELVICNFPAHLAYRKDCIIVIFASIPDRGFLLSAMI